MSLEVCAGGEVQIPPGDRLTAADLWAAPMFAYLRLAPTGRNLLAGFPRLQAWSELMLARPSLMATRYPAEPELAGISSRRD